MVEPYEYKKVVVDRVVDGDTVDMNKDREGSFPDRTRMNDEDVRFAEWENDDEGLEDLWARSQANAAVREFFCRGRQRT